MTFREAFREFLLTIVTGFRTPSEGDETAKHLVKMLSRNLEEFEPEVIDKARAHIERYRKDPWMPTIAECVEVCEHAKAGTLGDLLDPEGAKKRAAARKRIAEICGPGPRPVGVYPRD
jgi:hypothetical protein